MAYLSGYTKRVKVTSQNGQVAATITDFVYYLNLSSLPGGTDEFWDTVKTDGSDIRVTQSDGTTEVPIHVAEIDTVGETGVLFFKDDSDSGTNKDYYIYVNGTSSGYADTATYGKHNVWTDFDYVWLLNETPDGTADQIKNATANSHHGETEGTFPSVMSSKLEMDAIDFESGSSNYIDINGDFDLSLPHTFLYWSNAESHTGSINILSKWDQAATDRSFQFQQDNVRLRVIAESDLSAWGASFSAASTISGDTGSWFHYGFSHDGSGTATFYRNGASLSMGDTTLHTALMSGTSEPIVIGARTNGASKDNHYDGGLSMLMLNIDTQFSTNKILTYYNNQNAPGTFWGGITWEEDSSGTKVFGDGDATGTGTGTADGRWYQYATATATGTSTAIAPGFRYVYPTWGLATSDGGVGTADGRWYQYATATATGTSTGTATPNNQTNADATATSTGTAVGFRYVYPTWGLATSDGGVGTADGRWYQYATGTATGTSTGTATYTIPGFVAPPCELTAPIKEVISLTASIEEVISMIAPIKEVISLTAKIGCE